MTPKSNRNRIILLSAIVVTGALSTFLALLLKHGTEHYEGLFLERTQESLLLTLIVPIAGLALIQILRKHAFRNRANKGISEVFAALNSTRKLASYKIPSHFVNGFLTVVTGGSTGIEISTVVATGAIGSVAHTTEKALFRHKNKLIAAGISAGVTALFTAPLAGIFFVVEVLSRRTGKSVIVPAVLAAIVAAALLWMTGEPPLFSLQPLQWDWHALPWFALLGVLAGFHSAYLTRTVLTAKKLFSKLPEVRYKVLAAAIPLGILILLFPQLYGEGYHAMHESLETANTIQWSAPLLLTLGGLVLFKPVATAITLGGGGDGGVFAPSLFAGAFLGLLAALAANTFFGAAVVPMNFMVAGMAAVLSASIHAPLTALFVACGITADYSLVVPVLLVCLIARVTAGWLLPYTVYSYPVAKA